MERNLGFWKSGLGAVLLTVLFAVLAFQVNSTAATYVVPHIALGSHDNGATQYSTVIQIVNTEPTENTISATFFDEAGATSRIKMTSNNLAPFVGTISDITIPPHGLISIEAKEVPAYTALSGLINTSTGAMISTVIELRRGTGELLSRSALASTNSNMKRFSIPRIHDSARGLDTSFAITNTGVTRASLVATLYNAAGGVLKTRTREFASHEHFSVFAKEYFELTENLSSEMDFQSMEFDSSSSQFAAVAFGIEGAMMTNLPVKRIK